jgi:hypothetical protein
MIMRVATGLVAAAMLVAAAACGGSTTPQPEESAAPAADASHAEHAASGISRVFFVQPKDGDTIGPDAKIEFGSEQFAIAAVPPGEITAEQVRPGTGHYHLAVDAPCLPAGEIIPKADPWVHFGTGANTAETTLKPGTHTLTVQIGDDQHRTIEGLCQTITVNVK